MSKYELETDIDGFIERWLEVDRDYDVFVPANLVWGAMLHSAGLGPMSRRVWGLDRKSALEHMRIDLGISRQRARYYRYPVAVLGMAPGGTLGCYEQLKLSEYAVRALDAPLRVRPRLRRREMARV